jgi:hypothetical protein
MEDNWILQKTDAINEPLPRFQYLHKRVPAGRIVLVGVVFDGDVHLVDASFVPNADPAV